MIQNEAYYEVTLQQYKKKHVFIELYYSEMCLWRFLYRPWCLSQLCITIKTAQVTEATKGILYAALCRWHLAETYLSPSTMYSVQMVSNRNTAIS